MSLELFYSYAHEDEVLRDDIEKHLSLLRRSGLIVAWHDRRISAGDEWRDQIDSHARSAHIILLLISPDFIASDYCYNVEMSYALQRHAVKEAIVIPIILRPVDWSDSPFAHLQALPRDGKAITAWSNRDEALADVAHGIREVVEQFRANPALKTPLFTDKAKAQAQDRVLDAAIPSHIVKDRTCELQILIRLKGSPGLKGVLQLDMAADAKPEDVQSKDFKITFPSDSNGNLQEMKVQVQLTSPDFRPPTQTKQLIVPPDSDSEVASFFLTAIRTGTLKVLVEVQWEEALRGARRLLTECIAEADAIPAGATTNVVQIPLEVHSPQAASQTAAAPSIGRAVREVANRKPQAATIQLPEIDWERAVSPLPSEVPASVPQKPPAREPKLPPPTQSAPLPTRSSSKAAWIGASGAIAAALVAGVFSLYNVTPTTAPQQMPTPLNPAKRAPDTLTLRFRIIDKATNRPLPNSKVIVESGTADPRTLLTDSDGYSEVAYPKTDSPIHFIVEHGGYETVDRRVDAALFSDVATIRLSKRPPR